MICISENQLVFRIFKELICINKKNTEIFKVGKTIKNRNKLHNRRYTNGQYTQEKILNTNNPQGNANLNYIEISLHNHQKT